jgi:hypothetical protein
MVLTTFLGSAAILFNVVLILDTLGLPLHAGTVGGGLAVACIAPGWWAWRARLAARGRWNWPGWPRGLDWLWIVPPVLALTSVAVQAVINPLSGYDNIFRWNFLSLEILKEQGLGFYPPLTTADFTHYGWCDGIPPLVSFLNYGIYLGAGRTAPSLTAIRVALEAGLLFWTVHRFACSLWDDARAGWAAVGVFATSSLALWAVAIGQETGLTALTLIAMLYFLHEYGKEGRRSCIIWAGVTATVGALSREYGLVFILIGLAILLVQPRLRPGALLFAATAIVLAAPWYLRNAWLSGNPLYSQSLFGLFPVNRIHAETMRSIAEYWGLTVKPIRWFFTGVLLLVSAGVAGLFGMLGWRRLGRRGLPLVFAACVIFGLWLWSIGQTAGGWIYSVRVLAPAVAVAAVLSGWLGRILSPGLRAGCALALLPFAADAACRSWYLPKLPLVNPFKLSFVQWLQTRDDIIQLRAVKVWDILNREAGSQGIMVDHPSNYVTLHELGGHPVPMFSPRVDCLYYAHVSFPDMLMALRQRGIRFITLTPGSPLSSAIVRDHPFLRELSENHHQVARVGPTDIYDVDILLSALGHSQQ